MVQFGHTKNNGGVCEIPQIIPIKDLKNTSEIYESAMRRFSLYRDIELSEQQIKSGQVKDARTALAEMRTKYGL